MPEGPQTIMPDQTIMPEGPQTICTAFVSGTRSCLVAHRGCCVANPAVTRLEHQGGNTPQNGLAHQKGLLFKVVASQ